ncbi:sulfotransferase 1A1 [Lingula anatina]|uniref:Sulfotransferase 1A1 n=1 Tax=Lingula anatina TaxID=7574 RepID=A0A1S3JLC5_LINAN|nr:sulfotransferase 1A1 [Lingula anatina]|eukprot:XP_013410941.1 sulfotransferase 1A1 [Lingula anatina]
MHKIPGEHIYEGILMPGYHPPEIIEIFKNFQMHQSDCLVTAYPKSGQTWITEMVSLILHHQNLEEASRQPIFSRVFWPDFCHAGRVSHSYLKKIASSSAPRLLKTHMLYRYLPKQSQQKRVPMIHVLRNPKDVAVSYYHFYRSNALFGKFRGSWDEFFNLFISGHVAYGSYFDYVLEYWNECKENSNVLFLKYEEMLTDPREAVVKISQFLGKTLSSVSMEKIVNYTSFDSMKKNPATRISAITDAIDESVSPFYRKGMVGDWRNYFTEQQNTIFEKTFREKMDGSGLSFDFGTNVTSKM